MKVWKWIVLALGSTSLLISCCEEDTLTVPATVVSQEDQTASKQGCPNYYLLDIKGIQHICPVEQLDRHGDLGQLPAQIEIEYQVVDENPGCGIAPEIQVEEWEWR